MASASVARCTARARSARHPTLRSRATGALFLLLAAGCGGRGGAAACRRTPGPPSRLTRRAPASLAHRGSPGSRRGRGARRCRRDRLGATRQDAEGGASARLAADLRARVFRFDQSPSDAREALELYAAAAGLGHAHRSGVRGGSRPRRCWPGRSRTTRRRRLPRALSRVAPARRPGEGRRREAPPLAMPRRPRSLARRSRRLSARRAMACARSSEKATRARASAAPRRPGRRRPRRTSIRRRQARRQPRAGGAGGGRTRATSSSRPEGEAFDKGAVRVTSIERYRRGEGRARRHQSERPDDLRGRHARRRRRRRQRRADLPRHRRAPPRRASRTRLEVGGVVHRVRVGAHDGGTRVVLDLAASLYRRIFYLPDPFRIVIDVSTRPPVRADGASSGGGREVRRVAIDAGHGGIDAGAVGPTGLKEKDVTLDIAHRIAPRPRPRAEDRDAAHARRPTTFVPLDAPHRARQRLPRRPLRLHPLQRQRERPGPRRPDVPPRSRPRSRDRRRSRSPRARTPRAERAGRSHRSEPPRRADERHPLEPQRRRTWSRARATSPSWSSDRRSPRSRQRYPDETDQGVKSAGFFVLVGADMPAALFETVVHLELRRRDAPRHRRLSPKDGRRHRQRHPRLPRRQITARDLELAGVSVRAERTGERAQPRSRPIRRSSESRSSRLRPS